MYVLYWSNHGLQLYNSLAKFNTLYWDATGSLLKKSNTGKNFLYYELALCQPFKGKMGISVTSMVSENQSLPVVLDWLRCFQYAEKTKFGHCKAINYSKLIVSDQSMVLVLSALKEFNNENLESFLNRAYAIAKGQATLKDTQKTIVHLCKSHFLNSAKRHLIKKEVSRTKISFCLFLVGIVMKCQFLKDFGRNSL